MPRRGPEPCVAAAEAAGAEAAKHRPTAEQKRARIAELEERAKIFGDSAKQSAQAQVLERKWLRFLLVHGDDYGFDERKGPTVEQVKHFTTYCFCTRDVASAVGRDGLGDSYELQIRYMLAKFVFVSLKYKGWVGLSEHALHEKAEPFKFVVREHWKRLKQSDPTLKSTLKPFVKKKWCDIAYFLSQDHCMKMFEDRDLHPLVFVTRMAVMAFVRATCSRGGSFGKDWYDRVGKMLYWMNNNVLSVSDFTWAREAMELMLPDGTEEDDPLRGEVSLNRVKHFLFNAGYEYEMSVTADAVQAARRANTWLYNYQMCRGLFAVQYSGMSDAEIEEALRVRAEGGYEGGMPLGAKITLEDAARRWEAGEKSYLPALESEPFFVHLDGRKGKGGGRFVFTQQEIRSEYIGSIFRDVGDEQGFQPSASGENSMRRNVIVGVQKGAEAAGYDTAMHAKKVSQHRGDGHACREKVYEDSTATTDICAFLMGRTPQQIEKLKSMAMTRVPELAKYRKPNDVAKDDAIRVEIVQQNEQRVAIDAALQKYRAASAAKSAAKRSQAKAKADELTVELAKPMVTRRLEKQMLHTKRLKVFADGQAKLARMPIEEFQARKNVADLSGLTRAAIISKFAAGVLKAERRVSASAVQPQKRSRRDDVAEVEPPAKVPRESREQSRARRLARRAEQMGYELDDEESAEVAQLLASETLVNAEGAVEAEVGDGETADVETEGGGGDAEGGSGVETEGGGDVEMETEGGGADVAEGNAGGNGGGVGVALPCAPKGREDEFTRKRAAEDELLTEYKAWRGKRSEFASEKNLKLGTLDGMLARARKRLKF